MTFLLMELIYATCVCISRMRPSPSPLCIRGQRVLITGGNSGIGYSIAKEVLAHGASHVVLVARNESRLQDCVEELNSLKCHGFVQKVICISMDLSMEPGNIKQKIDELCVSIGGVDILINCAGYSIPGEFIDLELSTFSDMMNANYFSAINITHAVVPHMIKQLSGQLVFFSSIGGQLGIYGFTAYASSKYAIRGFAEVLYTELRPYGIGVSVAFPPDTDTPGLAKENLNKPKVTQLISEQAGLWQSDEVAKNILNKVRKRQFMIGCGSDGYFINALTCGAAPPSSLFEFWVQLLLMPVLRIYMLFMNTFFTSLIDQEHKKKQKVD